ncbi:neurturin-like [Lepus europaeus]|uniref:neurturin-like n=1 Tax=Lepus europaeus TaxID=9983 RepID=UPI002B45A8F1|nr:neurturin-like [Lepus europaeus]
MPGLCDQLLREAPWATPPPWGGVPVPRHSARHPATWLGGSFLRLPPSLQRWKAAALAWALCSSLLTFWMCPEGLGPALAPLRRPPRTLDARIAGLAQYRALLQGGPAPGPRLRAGPRRRRALQHSGARPCGLRELVVRVSELGLGYPSDEAALLHYCAGVCEAATRVHDLGLWRLRQQRRIQRDRVRAQPCCRPTTYEEKVSFLDVHSRYHTVRELWARECACV